MLFDTAPISKRDWISHELRDQTGRIIRLGFSMMRGGYRRLLLHPYRRRDLALHSFMDGVFTTLRDRPIRTGAPPPP